MSARLITAAEVSATGVRCRELDELTRDTLTNIDVRIASHPKMIGQNIVTYPLQPSVIIPGRDPDLMQRLLYANIINSLEARGFEVHIHCSIAPDSRHAKYILYVVWSSDISEDELRAINAVVIAHSVTADELEKIRNRTREERITAAARAHERAEKIAAKTTSAT